MDFSAKYRAVKYFGLWAEESADELGIRDALAILQSAAKKSYNMDVRTKELNNALSYLRRFAVRKRPYDDFVRGLEIQDPVKRVMAVYDALHRIVKGLS